MSAPRSHPMLGSRRAGLLVAALIVLAWINLAIIGAVTAGADDSRASLWRLQSLRARAAANSAAQIALRFQKDDPANHFTGVITLPGGVTAEIVSGFESAPSAPGTLIAKATDGEATQQVRITLTSQP